MEVWPSSAESVGELPAPVRPQECDRAEWAHPGQNFALAGSSAPHPAHARRSIAAYSMQNLARGGFSCRRRGHVSTSDGSRNATRSCRQTRGGADALSVGRRPQGRRFSPAISSDAVAGRDRFEHVTRPERSVAAFRASRALLSERRGQPDRRATPSPRACPSSSASRTCAASRRGESVRDRTPRDGSRGGRRP